MKPLKSLKFMIIFALFIAPCRDSGYDALQSEYTPERFNRLFRLAKVSILHQLETGKREKFQDIEYAGPGRGVFVRLINNRKERGCIGFIRNVSSLEEAVSAAAVDAAFFDSRFSGIRKEELPSLEIEITIIDTLTLMPDYNNFTLGRHTIYIKKMSNSAIMQAQIAHEKGYTREEFLRAVCRKAKLPEEAYQGRETEIYRANTAFMRKRFCEINTDK